MNGTPRCEVEALRAAFTRVCVTFWETEPWEQAWERGRPARMRSPRPPLGPPKLVPTPACGRDARAPRTGTSRPASPLLPRPAGVPPALPASRLPQSDGHPDRVGPSGLRGKQGTINRQGPMNRAVHGTLAVSLSRLAPNQIGRAH